MNCRGTSLKFIMISILCDLRRGEEEGNTEEEEEEEENEEKSDGASDFGVDNALW